MSELSTTVRGCTTITYQDIFRRKHASIYDLVFQQGWQVVALLDDISNDLDNL